VDEAIAILQGPGRIHLDKVVIIYDVVHLAHVVHVGLETRFRLYCVQAEGDGDRLIWRTMDREAAQPPVFMQQLSEASQNRGKLLGPDGSAQSSRAGRRRERAEPIWSLRPANDRYRWLVRLGCVGQCCLVLALEANIARSKRCFGDDSLGVHMLLSLKVGQEARSIVG